MSLGTAMLRTPWLAIAPPALHNAPSFGRLETTRRTHVTTSPRPSSMRTLITGSSSILCAVALVDSSALHLFDARMQAYSQRAMAVQLLQRFLTVNRKGLSELEIMDWA